MTKPSWYAVAEPPPWYNRWPDLCPCSPLEFANLFGLFYTLGTIFALTVLNAHFTCPALYGYAYCQPRIVFGYIVVGNIIANLICFHYFKRYNRINYLFPGSLRNDGQDAEHTKYCYTCEIVVPRRSHHCPLCDYCVLRKDHHCFMTGGCVGFGNHRYFITFLFWGIIGAGYGTIYTLDYLNKFYKPFWPLGWIDYIGPLAMKKWAFYQFLQLGEPCTLWHLCCCMLFSIGFASTWGAFGFFVSQWYFLFQGRTMQEHLKKDRLRDPGSFKDRIRMIFGPYFLANFIFPMPWFRNRIDPVYGKVLYNCYLKDM